MAGDEADRPNFLKNSIYGAVMSPYNPWLGETIVRNYLVGPGIGQRNFLRWAIRQDYPGLPTYAVTRQVEIDPDIVAPFIPTPGSPAGLVITVQEAGLVSGDYEHLVEAYVLDNFPENYDTAYESSLDKLTNNITIEWFGGGSATFSAGTYNPNKSYVVAHFYHALPEEVQNLVTGGTTTAVTSKPSTTGYGLDSSSNTGVVNYPMTYDERVVTVYTGDPVLPSDTDVTTNDLTDDVDFNGLSETWSKITYEGGDGNTEEVINKEHFLEIDEYRQVYTNNTVVSVVVNDNTPGAGQTETITTHRIGDHLRDVWDWRIDTQETILGRVINGSHVYSYEIGTTEPTLDALLVNISVSEIDSEYFPYMPIRLNNKSITHADFGPDPGSGLYELTNRAYRRATGGGHRFSKLVDEIEENEDIDDIDYAFTHHGVGLNVIEPACRKYMYEWFNNIKVHQATDSNYIAEYTADIATFLAQVTAMNDWVFAQADSGRPGYGDSPPPKPKLSDLKSTTIRLACEDSQLENLDMRITWVNITESFHNGVGVSGAVKGDVELTAADDLTWSVTTGIYPYTFTKNYSIEQMKLYWQTGSNTYKKLTIWGLVHNNYVYGGESVKITGKEGLADVDPTGFLVPLHFPTVQDLGLKDATQMATANTYIVFNSYEIVKQRWYEGFIGMLIIIIVIIILVVVFAPAGAAAGSGLLGGNAAVGAAMGLTGTAAIVAGAVANAIVAIALSKIIGFVSVAIFGDKIGAIVAAVINLAITLGAGGVSFDNLSELGTASNILAITSAIANGYAGYTQGAIAEIGDELEERQEVFTEEMKRIDDLLRKLRGNNDLNFDPLRLTDSVRGNDLSSANGYITETLDGFIHRTTMTGSDIVEITLSMVNDYAELSLELPS